MAAAASALLARPASSAPISALPACEQAIGKSTIVARTDEWVIFSNPDLYPKPIAFKFAEHSHPSIGNLGDLSFGVNITPSGVDLMGHYTFDKNNKLTNICRCLFMPQQPDDTKVADARKEAQRIVATKEFQNLPKPFIKDKTPCARTLEAAGRRALFGLAA
ncbi:MAG: hypothetical protein AB7H77_09150 [Bdellovibrionales bacterium]